jgi:hypothetical protein
MTCIFSTSKARLALVMTRGALTLSRMTLSLIQSGLLASLASIIMSCWMPQFTHFNADYHSVKCHSAMCRIDECHAITLSRMTLSLIECGFLAFLASIIMSCWVPTHCYVNYHSVKCHSAMCRFDECHAITLSRMTLSLIE